MIANPVHADFGEVPVAQLTQGHLEDFYKHLRENNVTADGKTINEYAGDLLRAAVACGWFPTLMVADVRNMHPCKVMWLFRWINDFLKAAFDIDPNSFRPLSNAQHESDGLPQN